MSKNNGNKPKVSRKQIEKLISGFEKQLPQLEKELERADGALSNAKLADIESQKAEALAKNSPIPRAPVFVLEETEELKHLKYERGRAVGKLGDIVRRIKLLKKALHLTPE